MARSLLNMPSEDQDGLNEDGTDPLTDDLTESQPEEQPSEEQVAQETEAEVAAETEPQGEPGEETEEEAQPEQFTFAGRTFPSQDAAQQAYLEMQRFQTQVSERNRQLEQALLQAAPLLEQMLQQPQPGQAPAQQPQVKGLGEIDWSDPKAAEEVERYVQAQIQAGVEQRLSQELPRHLQPIQAQQEQAVAQAQTAQLLDHFTREIDGFRADHPEVAEGTVTEAAMAQVMQEFQLNPTRASLEGALSATRSPELLSIFKAMPQLWDTDEGIAQAHKMAGVAPPSAQQQKVRTDPQAQAEARRKAHVETGGSGAPAQAAPGALPPDEFDEVMAIEDQMKSADNIFGLLPR